ncbi:hemolysin family protein [Clostridium thermobutyricum]|uniref:Magnesium and cobalt efflux protein CorC n=1 Tax=Clostridium thermobutyricum DSM 4928 TaxID=1121339 RepID=A0A1V4SY09_9CLOT|nr:hemolysin family protein [Clostridium thermobutyricum]OPX49614.1 magnesium and cobalt efflux protein CorC [Clostridium thermobutyricum DSM 4928]
MDSSYTGEIILLIVFLILSAFFAMAETSLMSLNKIKIRHMADSGVKKAKLVERLIENPNKLLGAILIGNTISNVATSSIATSLSVKLLHGSDTAVAISTAITTVLVLIFGEITPKTIAKQKSEKISLRVSKPINMCVLLFKPFVIIFTFISSIFIRLCGADPKASESLLTQEELKTMMDVSEEEGILEDVEKEMIFNVFDFADLHVKDVMIQRLDITAINKNSSYEEVLNVIKNDQYSRIPVYDENIDNIIGVLNVKDLIINDDIDKDFNLTNYIREVLFTFEFKKIAELFSEMKKTRNHMAIVLDEYGGTAGIATIEDLIEEIVGEIEDEYDQEHNMMTAIKDNEYIVDGSARLDDLSKFIGINIESDEFDSIGGLIIETIGGIPRPNDKIIINGVKFIVEKVDKNRIKKVRVLTHNLTIEQK